MKLMLGDCKEKLKELADNSIDSVVTDPPYGLSNHEQQDIIDCLYSSLFNQTLRPNIAEKISPVGILLKKILRVFLYKSAKLFPSWYLENQYFPISVTFSSKKELFIN